MHSRVETHHQAVRLVTDGGAKQYFRVLNHNTHTSYDGKYLSRASISTLV